MRISLLWLPDRSLVSGKREDVEVKEPLAPHAQRPRSCKYTRARCLFKGERRSASCRQVGRYLGVPAVPSAPEPLALQWLVESWFTDPSKQTN